MPGEGFIDVNQDAMRDLRARMDPTGRRAGNALARLSPTQSMEIDMKARIAAAALAALLAAPLASAQPWS